MALSAKLLAIMQKIEAADAAHFAGLRETAKKQKQSEAREKTREKKRANLRLARATRARLAKTKRKPQSAPQ